MQHPHYLRSSQQKQQLFFNEEYEQISQINSRQIKSKRHVNKSAYQQLERVKPVMTVSCTGALPGVSVISLIDQPTSHPVGGSNWEADLFTSDVKWGRSDHL